MRRSLSEIGNLMQLVVFYKKMNFLELVLFRCPGATKWIHATCFQIFNVRGRGKEK
jgi:hypothetical protein